MSPESDAIAALINMMLAGGGVGGVVVAGAVAWVAKKLTKIEDTQIDSDKFEQLCLDTSWLKDVHDQDDEDGVKRWYVRRSLERNIEDNTKMLAQLHITLSEIGTYIRQQNQNNSK